MPRKHDRKATDHKIDMELPNEVWLIAREIAERSGEKPESVLQEWLGGALERLANDPECQQRLRAHVAAGLRCCKAEGLDSNEYNFRSCQATMRCELRELRRECLGY
jgi:hypothetical protein